MIPLFPVFAPFLPAHICVGVATCYLRKTSSDGPLPRLPSSASCPVNHSPQRCNLLLWKGYPHARLATIHRPLCTRIPSRSSPHPPSSLCRSSGELFRCVQADRIRCVCEVGAPVCGAKQLDLSMLLLHWTTIYTWRQAPLPSMQRERCTAVLCPQAMSLLQCSSMACSWLQSPRLSFQGTHTTDDTTRMLIQMASAHGRHSVNETTTHEPRRSEPSFPRSADDSHRTSARRCHPCFLVSIFLRLLRIAHGKNEC